MLESLFPFQDLHNSRFLKQCASSLAKVSKHKWVDNSNGKNWYGDEGRFVFAEVGGTQTMNNKGKGTGLIQ